MPDRCFLTRIPLRPWCSQKGRERLPAQATTPSLVSGVNCLQLVGESLTQGSAAATHTESSAARRQALPSQLLTQRSLLVPREGRGDRRANGKGVHKDGRGVEGDGHTHIHTAGQAPPLYLIPWSLQTCGPPDVEAPTAQTPPSTRIL